MESSIDDLPGIDPGVLVLDWLDPKVRWLVLDCESVLGLCVRGHGRRLGFRDGSGSWYWTALGERCLTNPRRRISVTRQWTRIQRDHP